MAETYFNCGNSRLAEAGRDWANKHGDSIMSGLSSCKVRWGEFSPK